MTILEAVTSVVDRLSLVPPEADVSLVLRHAEREEIPAGTFGDDVPLTANGVAASKGLGSLLSGRELSAFRSSPLARCVDTARAMAGGAGWKAEPVPDRLLGDHGAFVVDPLVCGPLLLEIGIRELVRRQLDDGLAPPGMRPTADGVKLLLGMAAGGLGRDGLLRVHVTHDSILAVLVGRLFGLGVDDFRWPGYLDGLLLWRQDGRLHFSWPGINEGSRPLGG